MQSHLRQVAGGLLILEIPQLSRVWRWLPARRIQALSVLCVIMLLCFTGYANSAATAEVWPKDTKSVYSISAESGAYTGLAASKELETAGVDTEDQNSSSGVKTSGTDGKAVATADGYLVSQTANSNGNSGSVKETGEGTEEQDSGKTSVAAFHALILVNWDHPYLGCSPELVRLDTVIDKALCIYSNYHKVDRATGEAANAMFFAAKEDGMEKFVIDNAYRTIERQDTMWKKRLRKDASYGVNPYISPVKVLPGGNSEHSTGLALDIFCKSYRRSNTAFADTASGTWLAHNAHRFGFIVRYPANKQHITGVQFEPWHFRYVGVEPAIEIYEKGLCLEEYLNQMPEALNRQIS